MRRWVIVDDDPSIRDLFSAIGEVVPIDLLIVDSGHAALAHLERDDSFDALLTDISMPGMSGVDLAREARLLRPDMLFFAMTGFSREIETGLFDRVLKKPFTIETFNSLLAVQACPVAG